MKLSYYVSPMVQIVQFSKVYSRSGSPQFQNMVFHILFHKTTMSWRLNVRSCVIKCDILK